MERATSLDVMTDRELVKVHPLYPGGMTPRQVETRYRMENVLRVMRPQDRLVLAARHMQGITLDRLASAIGVTRQTVTRRIQLAEDNFCVAFSDHWLDPIPGEPVCLDLDVTENLSELVP